MADVLQQTLQGICVGGGWDYAVFWKLTKRNRMVLIWEDAYCVNPSSSQPDNFSSLLPPFENSAGENREASGEDPLSWMMEANMKRKEKALLSTHNNVDYKALSFLIAKTSYQVFSYGEGVIGRVAFTGKSQWVFAPASLRPGGKGEDASSALPSSFSSEKDSNNPFVNSSLKGSAGSRKGSAFDPSPNVWSEHFAAGIRTIAIISVAEGVIQLGAGIDIPEEMAFVHQIRSLFSQLQKVPGAFLSDSLNASFPSSAPASLSPLHPLVGHKRKPSFPPPPPSLLSPLSSSPGLPPDSNFSRSHLLRQQQLQSLRRVSGVVQMDRAPAGWQQQRPYPATVSPQLPPSSQASRGSPAQRHGALPPSPAPSLSVPMSPAFTPAFSANCTPPPGLGPSPSISPFLSDQRPSRGAFVAPSGFSLPAAPSVTTHQREACASPVPRYGSAPRLSDDLSSSVRDALVSTLACKRASTSVMEGVQPKRNVQIQMAQLQQLQRSRERRKQITSGAAGAGRQSQNHSFALPLPSNATREPGERELQTVEKAEVLLAVASPGTGSHLEISTSVGCDAPLTPTTFLRAVNSQSLSPSFLPEATAHCARPALAREVKVEESCNAPRQPPAPGALPSVDTSQVEDRALANVPTSESAYQLVEISTPQVGASPFALPEPRFIESRRPPIGLDEIFSAPSRNYLSKRADESIPALTSDSQIARRDEARHEDGADLSVRENSAMPLQEENPMLDFSFLDEDALPSSPSFLIPRSPPALSQAFCDELSRALGNNMRGQIALEVAMQEEDKEDDEKFFPAARAHSQDDFAEVASRTSLQIAEDQRAPALFGVWKDCPLVSPDPKDNLSGQRSSAKTAFAPKLERDSVSPVAPASRVAITHRPHGSSLAGSQLIESRDAPSPVFLPLAPSSSPPSSSSSSDSHPNATMLRSSQSLSPTAPAPRGPSETNSSEDERDNVRSLRPTMGARSNSKRLRINIPAFPPLGECEGDSRRAANSTQRIAREGDISARSANASVPPLRSEGERDAKRARIGFHDLSGGTEEEPFSLEDLERQIALKALHRASSRKLLHHSLPPSHTAASGQYFASSPPTSHSSLPQLVASPATSSAATHRVPATTWLDGSSHPTRLPPFAPVSFSATPLGRPSAALEAVSRLRGSSVASAADPPLSLAPLPSSPVAPGHYTAVPRAPSLRGAVEGALPFAMQPPILSSLPPPRLLSCSSNTSLLSASLASPPLYFSPSFSHAAQTVQQQALAAVVPFSPSLCAPSLPTSAAPAIPPPSPSFQSPLLAVIQAKDRATLLRENECLIATVSNSLSASHLAKATAVAGGSYATEGGRNEKKGGAATGRDSGSTAKGKRSDGAVTAGGEDSPGLSQCFEGAGKGGTAQSQSKPRPRDRQLLQDRVKELRGLIPGSEKLSIDSLLDCSIRHLVFLSSACNALRPVREKTENSAPLSLSSLARTTVGGISFLPVEPESQMKTTEKVLCLPGPAALSPAIPPPRLFLLSFSGRPLAQRREGEGREGSGEGTSSNVESARALSSAAHPLPSNMDGSSLDQGAATADVNSAFLSLLRRFDCSKFHVINTHCNRAWAKEGKDGEEIGGKVLAADSHQVTSDLWRIQVLLGPKPIEGGEEGMKAGQEGSESASLDTPSDSPAHADDRDKESGGQIMSQLASCVRNCFQVSCD